MALHETMQALVSYLVALVAGTTSYVMTMDADQWLQAGAVLLLVARLLQDVPKGVASAIRTYGRITAWLQKKAG